MSDDPDSETWELVLSATLMDTRQGYDPLPILQLDLHVLLDLQNEGRNNKHYL